MFCEPYKVTNISTVTTISNIKKLLTDAGVDHLTSVTYDSNGNVCLSVKTPIQTLQIHEGDIIQAGDGIIISCYRNKWR